MDAPVEHESAAVIFKSPPSEHLPGGALAASDAVFYREYPSYVELFERFLYDEQVAVDAAVLVEGQEFSGFFRCIDHFLNLARGQSRGLFAQDVVSGVKRGAGVRAVELIARRDDDKVEEL